MCAETALGEEHQAIKAELSSLRQDSEAMRSSLQRDNEAMKEQIAMAFKMVKDLNRNGGTEKYS